MNGWNPVALSALHHKHLQLGADMVELRGWQRPACYTGAEDEICRLSEAVGLCDVSPVGKLNVQGEEIDHFLDAAILDFDKMGVGGVSRGQLVTGDLQQAAEIARLAYDELLMLTAPGQAAAVMSLLEEHRYKCVHIVDITSALTGVRLAGPDTRHVLSRLTELDIGPDALPDWSSAQAKIAEVSGILVRRDAGDLLGFDLYFSRDYGEYMWESLMEAGEDYLIVPFGIDALGRLEFEDVIGRTAGLEHRDR
jgi:sarcosine oxidase subunit alpha